MITKAQFVKYEQVRQSGVTNMFDVRMVEALSGLDHATIMEIMKSYGELSEKYPSVRNSQERGAEKIRERKNRAEQAYNQALFGR